MPIDVFEVKNKEQELNLRAYKYLFLLEVTQITFLFGHLHRLNDVGASSRTQPSPPIKYGQGVCSNDLA